MQKSRVYITIGNGINKGVFELGNIDEGAIKMLAIY
jgi:hypothetical protein